DQYARGIINFATVLETQQRAFDARAAEVRLAEARLRNRIDLYQALGGPFGPADIMEARR
ncbi:MAG: TolC family protein, partial [Pseudomonadota bacterium]